LGLSFSTEDVVVGGQCLQPSEATKEKLVRVGEWTSSIGKFTDPDGRIVREPATGRIAGALSALKGSETFRRTYDSLSNDNAYTVTVADGPAIGPGGPGFGLADPGVPTLGKTSVEVNTSLHTEPGLTDQVSGFFVAGDIKLMDTAAHELFHARDQRDAAAAYRTWMFGGLTGAERDAAHQRHSAAVEKANSQDQHRAIRWESIQAVGEAAIASGPLMTAKYLISLPALVLRAVINPE